MPVRGRHPSFFCYSIEEGKRWYDGLVTILAARSEYFLCFRLSDGFFVVTLQPFFIVRLIRLKRLEQYGKAVYDSVRLPGVGRFRGVGHGHQASGQHHRDAFAGGLPAGRLGEAPVGQGDFGFSGEQHGIFLRSARRGVDVVFRCDCGGVLADCHGHGRKHGVGIGSDGTCTSMGKKTWSI